MTLEVYKGNSGLPMGKAEIGGGGIKADGALYQYMGSVATYNDLLALDTTDFEPGYTYDVQEDGMDYSWTGTEWNALGTHTDLSNYYTKDQTYSKTEDNALLAKKQDILTPNAPLTIASYIRSNAYGFTFSDSSHIYSTSGSSREYYSPLGEYMGNFISCNTASTDMWANSTFSTTQENFKSYIDIPLSKNKMITIPSGMALFIGCYNEDGVFLPISQLINTFSYTNGEGYYFYYAPNTHFLRVPQNKLTTTDTVNQPQVTTYSKFYLKDAGSSLTLQWQSVYDRPSTIATTNIEPTSTLASKMTVARVVRQNGSVGYNPSNAIDVSTLGLYDYTGNFVDFDPIGLTNLFDITGEQAYNYLDLHIGAGLSVDGNGNLVNTNPTAPAVFTGADGTNAGSAGLVPAPAATDNNKFLKGDGTFAEVPTSDLTNYYNKTESDELLNEKQDKLTPNAPLTISSYIKSNLTNMEISNDGRYVIRGNDATVPNLGKPYFDNADNCRFYCYGGNVPTNLNTYTSEEIMASIGYIQVPYTLGQIVNCGYMGTYSRSPVVFGKTVGDSFIPIFYMNFINTVNSTSTGAITTSDTVTPTRYSSSYITFNQTSTNTSFGTVNTSSSTSLYIGGLAQIYDNSTSITLTLIVGRDRGTYSAGIRSTVTDITLLARLREINAARIFPAQDTDSLYLTTAIGLYNYNSLLPYDLNVQAIPTEWGENLFNISGQQAYNYLDLHLGAGLSVDSNGNLVNTNPTAPSAMTGATSSAAGASGLVPAPAAGDDTKFLSGDGTFKSVPAPDLSNYYDKTETDGLLDGKEDSFNAISPLTLGVTQIGKAYDNNNNEVPAGTTINNSYIYLVDNTSGGVAIIDVTKPWTLEVKNIQVGTSSTSTVTDFITLWFSSAGYGVRVQHYPQQQQIRGNIGSSNGATHNIEINTPYDFLLTGNGSGTYAIQYKLSSDTEYTTLIAGSWTGNTSRQYIYIGSNYAPVTFSIQDITLINDNSMLFGTDNQLNLNIGAGLAVQNGNLVNTNPNPVDVSNFASKNVAQTFTASQTFGNGITVSAGRIYMGDSYAVIQNTYGQRFASLDSTGHELVVGEDSYATKIKGTSVSDVNGNVFLKENTGVLGTNIREIRALTQEEYDALTVKYYAWNIGMYNTLSATPSQGDTIYNFLLEDSGMTVASYDSTTNSITTSSGGGSYERDVSSDREVNTASETTLYVIKNVVS